MKKRSILFAGLFVYATLFAGVLKVGTMIPIKLLNSISSESKESPGFVIASNIKDENGKNLINEGTPVTAEVKKMRRKTIGRPGSLEVKFIYTQAVDGQNIMLNGLFLQEGENKMGEVLGVSLGVGLTILWPMLIYMVKKGGSAQLGNGMIFSNITPLAEYHIR